MRLDKMTCKQTLYIHKNVFIERMLIVSLAIGHCSVCLAVTCTTTKHSFRQLYGRQPPLPNPRLLFPPFSLFYETEAGTRNMALLWTIYSEARVYTCIGLQYT